MSDWWDKKLKGEKPTPQPVYPNPVTYSNRPVQTTDLQNTTHNLPVNSQITTGQAIRMWRGGEAHQREGNMKCPDCGSRNVFSRVGKGSNSTVNGAAPAPRCFECGWNGRFSQADQTSWAI